MNSVVISFLHGREIRLLEELSDRGIDTEKLTLLVLLDALGATGLSLEWKKHEPWIGPGPWLRFPMVPGDDDDEDEDDN